MPDSSHNKDDFFYPHYPYRGKAKPENIVFNANLQEFAQRVSYICNLETAGRITSEQAYKQIKDLWEQLDASREGLGIDHSSDDEV